MKEEGLYRLSGSDKQVRELKEKMVMGKDGKLVSVQMEVVGVQCT